MFNTYNPADVSIQKLPIKGVRTDRVHGKEYRVKPRFYAVNDRNLKVPGEWTVELHAKLVERNNGSAQEVTIVKVALAPLRTTIRMASLTRQSIMIVPATQGRYEGLPYAHVSFREVQSFGGRQTATRGEKDALPSWFPKSYARRLRLRATVQGKIQSDDIVGKRLGRFHDIKQVLVFDEWDDEEFIRFFFLLRVFSAEQGFTLRAQIEV